VSVIYEPRGRAREYAPLACNLYVGCAHGCTYCWAAAFAVKQGLVQSRAEFHASPRPRLGVLKNFAREAEALGAAKDQRPVQLCFTTDPCQPIEAEHHLTRDALRIMAENGLRAQVLTKGDAAGLGTINKLAWRPDNLFGASLCSLGGEGLEEWEPGAISPVRRVAGLAKAKDLGLTTWVSLEPTIWPARSLNLIRVLDERVDCFAVGKLNYGQPPEPVNWAEYREAAVALLEAQGRERVHSPGDTRPGERTYLIKHDLEAA
jgi:DNA repair photolyase